jgi:hypothetical protein
MSDQLISEINEDLRRENLERFWRRFGQYIVGGSVFILLLTVSAVVWQGYQERQRAAWTADLLSALALAEEGKDKAAVHTLEALRGSAQGELGDVARLWLGQMYLKREDREAARSVLKEVKTPGVYADLARVMAEEDADAATGAFRSTAQEVRAARLLAAGDVPGAVVALKGLRDDALTPAALRERATLLLAALPQQAKPEAGAPR